MNFILFHKGPQIPGHIQHCINQIFKSNPDASIYFITNLDVNIDNVNTVKLDTLEVPNIGSYYLNDANGALFRNSMHRLFYIETFMRLNNIKNVIHVDNDVMIYEDINIIQDKLNQFPFIMTEHNLEDYVFGFSYIRDADALKPVVDRLLPLVQKGERSLEIQLGCMPHEMRLLKFVGDGLIQKLPIIPSDEHYDLFGYCFDPSTYGQILGGLSPSILQHHYIGKQVFDGNIKIKFENHKPIGYYKDNSFSIFNLHIHNKNLGQFI